ncbi:MAG: ATP-binding protein [Vicinamibacterales bacterium]
MTVFPRTPGEYGGNAPDVLSSIFDMFMQADRTSGLGLPVAKRLVEPHGGTVVGRSEGLGRGSEFAVRLPIAAK